MIKYENLSALATPIDALTPHPDNYNEGNVDLIAESLRVNGQYKPIVYRAETNEVVAGNHTLLAAKQLGWHTIAAIGLDIDDTTARRILIVDNQSARVSNFDDDALLSLIESLPSLEGTGFNEDIKKDLEALTAPPDLDALAEQVGDFEPEQAWPIIKIKVHPTVVSAWKEHIARYDGRESAAFAALLGIKTETSE